MKKILIAVMLIGTLAQANMCLYYLKTGNKNSELATHSDTYLRVTYLEMAISNYVNAKYECPTKYEDGLSDNIDTLTEILAEAKGN